MLFLTVQCPPMFSRATLDNYRGKNAEKQGFALTGFALQICGASRFCCNKC